MQTEENLCNFICHDLFGRHAVKICSVRNALTASMMLSRSADFSKSRFQHQERQIYGNTLNTEKVYASFAFQSSPGGQYDGRREEMGKGAQTLSTHGTSLLRSFLLDPVQNAMLFVFA
jgi:hypothetical protein